MKKENTFAPQISQAPPKTVKELLWKIIRCHNTRLKSINEYSKVETSCIWCLYRARDIQKRCIVSFIRTTVQIITNAIRTITEFFPACCFPFYGKQVPKGSKNLQITAIQLAFDDNQQQKSPKTFARTFFFQYYFSIIYQCTTLLHQKTV